MKEKITQTAGREALGEFAPEFARFNDDILFGENWNNGDIDLRTRSLITVIALMAQGITDSSLKYHISNAKSHGVTRKEMAAAITHAAFYAGWPKAWATFNLAKEVYSEPTPALTERDRYQSTIFFPVGEPNPYGGYFVGQSYPLRFRKNRSRCSTLRSNPAAATTGTSITRKREADRCSSASAAEDTTVNGERIRWR